MNPAEASVNVTQSILDLEVRSLAGQMSLDRLLQCGTILFVGQVQPFVQRRHAVVGRQADHQLPSRGAVERVGGDVPVPDSVVRAVDRQFVTLLRFARGLERGKRVAVQPQHFFLVALLGLQAFHVHPVRAERQVDRSDRQGQQPPLLRLPQDRASHRRACTDVVARSGPEEVRLPDGPHRSAGWPVRRPWRRSTCSPGSRRERWRRPALRFRQDSGRGRPSAHP